TLDRPGSAGHAASGRGHAAVRRAALRQRIRGRRCPLHDAGESGPPVGTGNDMISVLRGGIVGCGYFAQHHLEAWRRIPEAQVVAACDLEFERACKAAPRAYVSAEEMLDREKLDFLDVATRAESHLPIVRLAASARVPVICQKPVAPDWETAVEMV